jgi:hypothetical protein
VSELAFAFSEEVSEVRAVMLSAGLLLPSPPPDSCWESAIVFCESAIANKITVQHHRAEILVRILHTVRNSRTMMGDNVNFLRGFLFFKKSRAEVCRYDPHSRLPVPDTTSLRDLIKQASCNYSSDRILQNHILHWIKFYDMDFKYTAHQQLQERTQPQQRADSASELDHKTSSFLCTFEISIDISKQKSPQ